MVAHAVATSVLDPHSFHVLHRFGFPLFIFFATVVVVVVVVVVLVVAVGRRDVSVRQRFSIRFPLSGFRFFDARSVFRYS